MKSRKTNFYKYLFIDEMKPKISKLIFNAVLSMFAVTGFIFGFINEFSFLLLIIAISISVFTQGLVWGNIFPFIVFSMMSLILKTELFDSVFYAYPENYLTKIPVFVIFFWGLACIIMYQIHKYLFVKGNYQSELKNRIELGKEKISKISLDVVNSLMDAYILKNPDEKSHITNVAYLSEQIAKRLNCDDDVINQAYYAGLLHDIGKIRFSDEFMSLKDLSEEEFAWYKTHVDFGAELLEKLSLEKLASGVKYHHENYDGTGYPEGLKGEEIPFLAQIVRVANKMDRLLSKNIEITEVVAALKQQSGITLNPNIVSAALDFIL